jgi:hypothetical protein
VILLFSYLAFLENLVCRMRSWPQRMHLLLLSFHLRGVLRCRSLHFFAHRTSIVALPSYSDAADTEAKTAASPLPASIHSSPISFRAELIAPDRKNISGGVQKNRLLPSGEGKKYTLLAGNKYKKVRNLY